MSEQAEIQAGAAGPVREDGRVLAMDVARGFALLGIFCVNIECFEGPFAELMNVKPPEGPLGEVIAHYFVAIFCQGKFYTLFSMLFGMGLVIQRSRAVGAGRDFSAMYLRRLGALCVLGLVHGLLLWYGDILFIYGFCGSIAFFFRRLRALPLAMIAAGLLSFAVLLGMGMSLAQVMTPQATQSAGSDVAAPATPGPVLPGMEAGGALLVEPGEPKAADEGAANGPKSGAWPSEGDKKKLAIDRLHEEFWPERQLEFNDPLWLELEREAYREGPYRNAQGFRFVSWRLLVGISVVSYGWHVLSMFFFGMALAKAGVFAAENRAWRVRMVLAGLVVGLPMSALSMYATAQYTAWGAVSGAFLLLVGGPLMSLGYLGGVALVVDSGRVAWAVRAIANVGRMGLTNYLMQTVLATFVFYHWGLAQFASFSSVECVALVLGIYAFQIVVSTLWMSRFRFGPVEWVWRTLTYLKAQPMVKNARE